MEPKSMPKLIKNQCQNWYRKRSGKSWKFKFFWKGKTLIFERRTLYCCSKTSFARLLARWMREREIHKKTIENEVKIHPNIDTKSIQISYSKEVMQKTWKIIQNRARKGAKSHTKNLSNNLFEKRVGKRGAETGSAGWTWAPVRVHVKINKTHTEILQKFTTFEDTSTRRIQTSYRKTHTDYPTDEAKHLILSNTPRAPTGPERIYWTQGPPGLPGQKGQFSPELVRFASLFPLCSAFFFPIDFSTPFALKLGAFR